jgi:hypothetical protein
MALVTVTCTNCRRIISLEGTKIPAGRVSFACPGCKEQVVLDRSAEPDSGGDAAPTAGRPDSLRPGPEAPPRPDPGPGPNLAAEVPDGPRPRPASTAAEVPTSPSTANAADPERSSAAPAGSARPSPAATVPEPPPGTTLPSGLVICDDQDLFDSLRRLFEEFGSELRRVGSAAEIRALPPEELPELVIQIAGKLPPPPLEELRPLTGIAPIDRRRVFIVLLASNLSTLDGNTAFVYDVNLTINRSDLDRAPALLHTGLEYHRRLYRRFQEAAATLHR